MSDRENALDQAVAVLAVVVLLILIVAWVPA